MVAFSDHFFGITQGYVGIMGVCRDIEGLYRENEKMEATI